MGGGGGEGMGGGGGEGKWHGVEARRRGNRGTALRQRTHLDPHGEGLHDLIVDVAHQPKIEEDEAAVVGEHAKRGRGKR